MKSLIKYFFAEDNSKNILNINRKQRKLIISLILLAVLGLFLLTLDNLGSNNNNNLSYQDNLNNISIKNDDISVSNSYLNNAEKTLANRLENILGQVEGVGGVSVSVTLDSSSEYLYALNTKNDESQINERAQDGSNRITKEKREDSQLVMKNMSQGKNEPIIIKEKRPDILGVMVVAEGANDVLVKERINKAVQTLLNIPSHRVTVLPKERKEN